MNKAKLIERGPEGTYLTTAFGRLLLSLSKSMDFAFKYDDYFLTHDTNRISLPFVNRLGELSNCTLISDLNVDLARWETLIKEAKDKVWVMTPQAMGHLSRVMADKLPEGIKIRSILSETTNVAKADLPSGKNVERKILSIVPMIMLVLEKEASVSFPKLDGNVDFPSFFSTDSTFLNWANDLFLYYWEKAKTWYV